MSLDSLFEDDSDLLQAEQELRQKISEQRKAEKKHKKPKNAPAPAQKEAEEDIKEQTDDPFEPPSVPLPDLPPAEPTLELEQPLNGANPAEALQNTASDKAVSPGESTPPTPKPKRKPGKKTAENAEEQTKSPEENSEEIPISKEKAYKIAIHLLSVLLLMSVAFFVGLNFYEKKYTAKQNEIESILEIKPITEAAIEKETEPVLVNINTATVAELCSLSGIGEKKAQAIIEYRNENGLFTAKEELMNIKGIGEGIFEKIKDLITL